MANEKTNQKSDIAGKEEKILKFWHENNIFQKSLEKKSSSAVPARTRPKGEFVFYDGPPFATGLPHYGNILPGIIKDVIPRFKTMRGYHVRRRWGWDCHGLPVENEVERELSLGTKKDIEGYGIDKFNKRAREAVLRHADDWRKIIPRTGRWVDMERDYRTMDWTYTESVWWVFKTLYDKELIYEGFKAMHICPRCETTLSNFEVSQGYKDVTDLAVTVKLSLKEEPQTSLLVWTTTPWTLPGNAAAAVNENLEYVKVRIKNPRIPEQATPSDSDALGSSVRGRQELRAQERYIVAKSRVKEIFGEHEHEVVEEFTGSKLVGKEYTPPFGYYTEGGKLKNRENGWKVYAADFVGADEGTGIVHIAPAFGEDDMELGKKYGLPFIQHVTMDGTFKPDVTRFAGQQVKPKDSPQQTDIELIKYLAHKNLLFAKEKITHAYPHCWRCETPLLNYAASSWFVEVTKLKDALIRANKHIGWVPRDIRDGRFGKWLGGARDWAISRARFWGAPIPVWKCTKCESSVFAGSLGELKENAAKSGNTYFIMRHGEARSNVEDVIDTRGDKDNRLTEKGRNEVEKTAKFLKGQNIDLVVASPLVRTQETARLLGKLLNIRENKIITDERLRETNVGIFNGKPVEEFHRYFSSLEERFTKTPPGGERYLDIKKRMTECIYELDKKYSGKNIVVISHSDPLWMLWWGALGMEKSNALALRDKKRVFIKTGEVKKLPFVPLPHDETFALDLHRPYIDEYKVTCPSCGGRAKRVPEVFDCWFESGAMPYGEHHYPFEHKDIFNPVKKKGFPADFIAEGLDQTRGWFYSLLVLGTGLFETAPYRNVVVNGLILAEDGKKMSKRLKNYPDPLYILDRYGADSLRLYMLASPAVRGEPLNFSEKGVGEVQNKTLGRLRNVVSFFELYSDKSNVKGHLSNVSSTNVLDKWILVRLTETINKITYNLEQYELDKAARPIEQFVDDLSTWYVRRSRERFKGDDEADRNAALGTTRYVLCEFSKAVAPFAPFVAEEIFGKVKSADDEESVHLASWPKVEPRIPVWPDIRAFVQRLFGTNEDLRLLQNMQEVRDIVTPALEARMRTGIKVRQPLKELRIKNYESRIGKNEQLLGLIKDEVNVKEISFDDSIENEVWLDTEITPELKKEGQVRELIRAIQDLRKQAGLTPAEKVTLRVETGDAGEQFIRAHEGELKKATSLAEIEFADVSEGESIVIDELQFLVVIRKS